MCKGADSIIEPLLKKKGALDETNTNVNLEAFSSEGLRTLVIAEKPIHDDFYTQWKLKYDEALMLMHGKDEAVARISKQLECDLELVGSTAIEDKLQDSVPETIAFIKKAGVKVWVLTGDKIETAINIGYSCELLVNDMELFQIDQDRSKDIRE
jgi:phospholipid-translocating ATPase